LSVIEGYFEELLEEQEFLATPEQWRKMLALIPKKFSDSLDKEFAESSLSSLDKWRRLKNDVKVN